jgi:hypothetical protein
MLLAATWISIGTSSARDNIPTGCTSSSQIPGDFVNKCALAGGDEVRCSGSTPMCCKTTSEGTHCYDNPDDVKGRRGGLKVPTLPGGGTLAPPSRPPKPRAPAAGKSSTVN